MLETFYAWAEKYCENARMINPSRNIQVGQFFFGHFEKQQLISEVVQI